MVDVRENFFADHGGVILTPSSDDRIEVGD
jgi:hypothetical protein